jgi:hypothetical protein
MRLRKAKCATLLEMEANPGGTNEVAGLEDPTGNGITDGRSALLGPGLPVPSEMGKRTKAVPQTPGGKS